MISFEDIAFVILLILIFLSLRKNDQEDFLNTKNANQLRGIFALLIIIFHIAKDDDLIFPIFDYFAITVVAAFFFISGFGLMKGYINKPNYHVGYLQKRFVKVLLPYIIMTLVYWAYRTFIGEHYSLYDVWRMAISYGPIVMYSWFLISLFVQYFYFYVLIFICRNKKNILLSIVLFLILVDLFLAVFYNYGNASYFNYMFGLGIIYANYETQINQFINKNIIVLAIVAISLIFLTQYFRSSIPITNEIFLFIKKVLFVFGCLVFMSFFKFENEILNVCGNLSMEIYMTQGISKMIIRRFLGFTIQIQDFFIFVFNFHIVILFS